MGIFTFLVFPICSSCRRDQIQKGLSVFDFNRRLRSRAPHAGSQPTVQFANGKTGQSIWWSAYRQERSAPHKKPDGRWIGRPNGIPIHRYSPGTCLKRVNRCRNPDCASLDSPNGSRAFLNSDNSIVYPHPPQINYRIRDF